VCWLDGFLPLEIHTEAKMWSHYGFGLLHVVVLHVVDCVVCCCGVFSDVLVSVLVIDRVMF
jgi:hypothetical protein